MPLHTSREGYYKKTRDKWWQGCGKGLLHTVDGDVNWYSIIGSTMETSQKNKN